jgi:hypothetical protein
MKKIPIIECEWCGARLPAGAEPCTQKPELVGVPRAMCEWVENGKTLRSWFPQPCIERLAS